jgi:hypothetical protein
LDEYATFMMTNIRTMENLDVKYPYIDQAEVIGLSRVLPLLLIGKDNCDLIVAKEVIQVNPDTPAIS